MIGAPASARGVRRRVDWRRAAQLLAEDKSPRDVAEALGCAPKTISRRLTHDRHFNETVKRLMATCDPEETRLQDLRRTLHQAIESEVQNGNVRVILWLADRLKLIRPPDQQAPQSQLDDLIGGMSAAELEEFESLTDAS